MANKVAEITGASSGFGLLTAVEIARRGFKVLATMRDLGRGTYLEEAAAAAGVADNIEVGQLDVTEIDAIPRWLASVMRERGRDAFVCAVPRKYQPSAAEAPLILRSCGPAEAGPSQTISESFQITSPDRPS